jgi:hypothetical protein
MATTAPATKKSTKGRKSAAIALAIVGVAGLSLASAAQLTVNSSSLGAGTSVVASCDTDGIAVTYTNVYSTTGYNTSAVVLSGIAPACNGLAFRVQVTGAGGVALGAEVVGVVPAAPATSATASLAVAQPAASILGVSVVISG